MDRAAPGRRAIMANRLAATGRVLATDRERTKRSQELFERTGHVLEEGTTRMSVIFSPYACYIGEAQGCRMADLDGKGRIDFLINDTSLIHGHACPPFAEAVRCQTRKRPVKPPPAG
jgi:glutamate-1-semialdehyde aminotransferase